MPVDWKSAENNERLLACLFLSIDESGGKVNYKRIAQLFGQGTTGNAIDCNFRKYRAAAKKIKEELDSGITQPPPPTTPRKPKTPKKDALSGVQNGRVEKPATPTKNKHSMTVKMEEMPTPPSDFSYETMHSSFGAMYDMSSFGTDAVFDDEV